MVVGAGLKVGEDGIDRDHHFLVPRAGSEFRLLAGAYNIEIYATLIDGSAPLCLGTVQLSLSQEQAETLQRNEDATVFYEWGPESQSYHVSLETRKNKMNQIEKILIEMAESMPEVEDKSTS